MSDVAIGVAIAVFSSIVGTLGKQLLRFAELQRQSGGSLARQAQFCGVLGQMVMSPVLDIMALGWAPQTVLAPFNGLSLVWNTILAVRARDVLLRVRRANHRQTVQGAPLLLPPPPLDAAIVLVIANITSICDSHSCCTSH